MSDEETLQDRLEDLKHEVERLSNSLYNAHEQTKMAMSQAVWASLTVKETNTKLEKLGAVVREMRGDWP